MKSLSLFKKAKSSFVDNYGVDVRQQVAVESPFEGEVALEIEVEGTRLPPAYGGPAVGRVTWVTHNEGSLRNGGREYVFSEPAPLSAVEPMLTNLFEFISVSGGRIVNSTRCSTHVHVNMRGVKLNKLASFVALYGIFEDVLTNWCAPSRRGNLFALRMKDSSFAVTGWKNAFERGMFEWNHEQRYLALNPAALQRFGSLEIRTLQGIETPRPAVIWCEALLRLRDVSGQYSDPREIANQISGLGGEGFFDQVFEGLAITPELREANVDKIDILVREAFRRVQPIIYSLPWDDVLPEINKVWVPDPFSLGAPKRKKARAFFEDPMRALEPAARARRAVEEEELDLDD